MTIVGDSNQQILPYDGESSLKSVSEVFNDYDVKIFKLVKSYRSTREIMEYSNKYLDDTTIVPMVRTGKPVNELVLNNEESLKIEVIKLINEFKKDGLENIAIIVRDLVHANKIWSMIKSEVSAKIIEKENIHINEGIMVMPSYYAKGLEFDGAIIVDESMEGSFKDNLMYIMCTRALHRLAVIKKNR